MKVPGHARFGGVKKMEKERITDKHERWKQLLLKVEALCRPACRPNCELPPWSRIIDDWRTPELHVS